MTKFNYAIYAAQPDQSKGRLIAEAKPKHRSEFQRDRDRIIHCGAFRKLEYKTQVFVNHEGDYYRTRLTHTLEVSQIARSISRSLGLDEDLAEAVSLAHDLGHTPFGHAGEDALNEAMQEFGGFNHNDQTLRVLTLLEQRYPTFDGLNLTWETLEGVVKHNGPWTEKKLPLTISDYNHRHDLMLSTYPSAEAQIAALADDIAYSNHDIDDGLRAGLFTIDDIQDVALVKNAFMQSRKVYPQIEPERLIAESIRHMIGAMVSDVIDETNRRLAELKPKSTEDVRDAEKAIVSFSDNMQSQIKDLKSFLTEKMYRHYRVNRMTSKARRVVRDLFEIFTAETECLPEPWRVKVANQNQQQVVRVVADYIAGMTDRFALDEHRRLFDLYAKS